MIVTAPVGPTIGGTLGGILGPAGLPYAFGSLMDLLFGGGMGSTVLDPNSPTGSVDIYGQGGEGSSGGPQQQEGAPSGGSNDPSVTVPEGGTPTYDITTTLPGGLDSQLPDWMKYLPLAGLGGLLAGGALGGADPALVSGPPTGTVPDQPLYTGGRTEYTLGDEPIQWEPPQGGQGGGLVVPPVVSPPLPLNPVTNIPTVPSPLPTELDPLPPAQLPFDPSGASVNYPSQIPQLLGQLGTQLSAGGTGAPYSGPMAPVVGSNQPIQSLFQPQPAATQRPMSLGEILMQMQRGF